MAKAKKQLLIAYKDEKVRQEIVEFFDKNDYVVLMAADGKEAVECFFSNNHQINLMLIGHELDGYGGIEVLNIIREYSQVPVLMLGEEFSEEELVDALNNDVDHYIFRPYKMNVLKAFVDKVLRRQNLYGEEIIHGALKIDQTAQKVYLDDAELNLTPKEYALINYFIQHKNVLLTRETILDAVWGFDYQGDIRTVDTLIKQLRKKLTAEYPYIQSVYGMGYRFEEITADMEE